jgi:hypothetical protein
MCVSCVNVLTYHDASTTFHTDASQKKISAKRVFFCFYGLFEFNKPCFGLRNGPSIFQAALDRALARLLWQSCVIYREDCLVFADGFESMMCRLDEVFDRLEHFEFRLNLEWKCAFSYTRMPFLGMILENDTLCSPVR